MASKKTGGTYKLQRLAANEKFCCLKVDDLFSVIVVPGGLDDYDDDEEFVDD